MSASKNQFSILKTRALLIQAVRDFFVSNDFLEVETPIRCPDIIPEAHIDPVQSEGWYLTASPESCMKRLLSSGYDKIFQICKTFRKGERGKLHLPELTLLEWYEKDSTYLDLMDRCTELIQFVSRSLNCPEPLPYQGNTIQLNTSWQRLTVENAFKQYSDISLSRAIDSDRFDEIISFKIEPHLGTPIPAFLLDYPACYASLSQLKPYDPETAQRVELYIAGIELANGFTELTDPIVQKKRFEIENSHRKTQGKEILPLPQKFLADLHHMPPAAGMALGIDRLVMLFTDSDEIGDVVTFTPETL